MSDKHDEAVKQLRAKLEVMPREVLIYLAGLYVIEGKIHREIISAQEQAVIKLAGIIDSLAPAVRTVGQDTGLATEESRAALTAMKEYRTMLGQMQSPLEQAKPH
jgi:hypothetical protein